MLKKLQDIVFISTAYKKLKCWKNSQDNIYEQDKFHAQLSWAWRKFYNLGIWKNIFGG